MSAVHVKTAVLVFELAKPRTAKELSFYTDMSEDVVMSYLNAMRAKRIVHIADWRFNTSAGRYYPCYALDLSCRKADVNQPQGASR